MSGQKRASISGNSASPRLAWLLQHNQYPRTTKLQESGPTVIRPAFAFSKCIICLFVVYKSLSPSTLQLSGFAKFHSSATWTKILVQMLLGNGGGQDSNPALLIMNRPSHCSSLGKTRKAYAHHQHTHIHTHRASFLPAARGILRSRVLRYFLESNYTQTGKATEQGIGHVMHRKWLYPTANHSRRIIQTQMKSQ